MWRGRLNSFYPFWKEWYERLFVLSAPPLPLPVSCLLNCTALLHLFILYCYFYAKCSSELASCMPPYSFLLTPILILIPFTRVSQYLYFFTPFNDLLWNYLSVCISSLLWLKTSGGEYQNTSCIKLDKFFWTYFSSFRIVLTMLFGILCFAVVFLSDLLCRMSKTVNKYTKSNVLF